MPVDCIRIAELWPQWYVLPAPVETESETLEERCRLVYYELNHTLQRILVDSCDMDGVYGNQIMCLNAQNQII